MPRYECELQMPDGQSVTETVTADSATAAVAIARRRGGQVVNVVLRDEQESLVHRLQNIRLEGPPKLKDIISFSKQLAVMIKAGISVHESIEGIAEQVVNLRFQKMLLTIKSDVESGQSLSAAMAKHPKAFSSLYVNMVRASEMSGTFAHMLGRIVEYLEQQDETRRMVKGAMIYPAVLFTASISALVFLLTWVLPRFMGIFKGKEHLLPKATVALQNISEFLQHDWYYLLAGLAAAVMGFAYSVRTAGGRQFWDVALLHIPVIKKMMRALYITRSLQSLGELINGGVPILDSLAITADIAGNTQYRDLWTHVSDSVREGNKIVAELQHSDLLPKSVVQMIAAGEESGRLGEVLADISEYYQRELKETVSAVTTLLEPIMIVFMGGMVGFIAISIILPVFKMSAIAKG